MSQKILDCPPDPLSHFQSIRAIGYDFNRAISDIVDNSISANAKNIYIIHHFDDRNTKIAILDDGNGMNKEELIQGMRLNSKNPLDDRDEDDLGRFGLGLKSASLSQSEILTVRSKKEGGDNTACWDLSADGNIARNNHYGLILNPDRKDGKFILDLLDKFNSGTIVLWENLKEENFADKKIRKNKENFQDIIFKIQDYIEITFHRFIGLGGKVNIFTSTFEGFSDPIKLKEWDPYLKNHPETFQMPTELIDNNLVSVTGFVLPYHTKISQAQQVQLEGIRGQLNHQGFYLYRNKRLIIAGTWFKYFAQHNQYNLARIQIDLPNTRDYEWMLDISKSEVIPPKYVEPDLKTYAKNVRKEVEKRSNFRGNVRVRKAKNTKNALIWNTKDLREDKVAFIINRDHFIIKQIIDGIVVPENKNRLKDLLTLIEKHIPITDISNVHTADGGQQRLEIEHSNEDYNFSKKNPLKKFKEIYDSFIKQGRSKNIAFNQTIAIEPFRHNSGLYEELKDEILKEDSDD